MLHHIDEGKKNGGAKQESIFSKWTKLLFKHRRLRHRNSFDFWAGDAKLLLTQKNAQTIGIGDRMACLAAESSNIVCLLWFLFIHWSYLVSPPQSLCLCAQCNCFDSSAFLVYIITNDAFCAAFIIRYQKYKSFSYLFF